MPLNQEGLVCVVREVRTFEIGASSADSAPHAVNIAYEVPFWRFRAFEGSLERRIRAAVLGPAAAEPVAVDFAV